MFDQTILQAVINYNPDTGIITRTVSRRGDRIGKPAGCISHTTGYNFVSIFNKQYPAHRLAWLYTYGEWPTCEIDHINGNRTDNRIANLRLSTKTQNGCNKKIGSQNTTGYKNVYWYKAYQKWVVNVKIHKKMHFFGYYSDLNEAIQVARRERVRLHGEFARHC